MAQRVTRHLFQKCIENAAAPGITWPDAASADLASTLDAMELWWKGPAEALSSSSNDIQLLLGSLAWVNAARGSGPARGSKDICEVTCTAHHEAQALQCVIRGCTTICEELAFPYCCRVRATLFGRSNRAVMPCCVEQMVRRFAG